VMTKPSIHPFYEGRMSQRQMRRETQIFGRLSSLVRQAVCQKDGRVSLYASVPKTRSSPCLPDHRLLLVKRLLTGLQRDDTKQKAGDEIRTRDSLLGRQVVTKTTLACCKSASQADRCMSILK
jgi:hypothetical protein